MHNSRPSNLNRCKGYHISPSFRLSHSSNMDMRSVQFSISDLAKTVLVLSYDETLRQVSLMTDQDSLGFALVFLVFCDK